MTCNKITINEEALAVYNNCVNLIQEANRWVLQARTPEEADRRRHLHNEMERSFYSGITHLMFVSQEHDGELKITRDGSLHTSFYWSHESSGYHGGFIFHRHHTEEEGTPIGSWSIHT